MYRESSAEINVTVMFLLSEVISDYIIVQNGTRCTEKIEVGFFILI